MGKKGVEDMINEIQVYLDTCKRQTLAPNKIVVPKEELEEKLNELRLKLPSEFERSKKIMRNKEAILASARTRSDAIISESVNEANRLVETNHITELAKARADEILAAARAEANQIVEDAQAEAQDVRLAAMNYTQGKLTDMRNMLKDYLETESNNYRSLCDAFQQQIMVVEDNITDMDTSINLLTGQEIAVPYQNQKPMQAADYDDFDDDYDDDEEEEAYSDDYSDDYDDDESMDYDDDEDEDDDFDDEDFDDGFLDE